MAIETKRMSWVRKPSAWESAQAWRQRRAAMQADFANASAITVNAFAAAQSNRIDGLAQLAAEAAAKRVQSQIGAALSKYA